MLSMVLTQDVPQWKRKRPQQENVLELFQLDPSNLFLQIHQGGTLKGAGQTLKKKRKKITCIH